MQTDTCVSSDEPFKRRAVQAKIRCLPPMEEFDDIDELRRAALTKQSEVKRLARALANAKAELDTLRHSISTHPTHRLVPTSAETIDLFATNASAAGTPDHQRHVGSLATELREKPSLHELHVERARVGALGRPSARPRHRAV